MDGLRPAEEPRSREFGAQLALPIWIDYMGRALRGVPQVEPEMPAGVATVAGELYYADMVPGTGFVASIGLDAARGGLGRCERCAGWHRGRRA